MEHETADATQDSAQSPFTTKHRWLAWVTSVLLVVTVVAGSYVVTRPPAPEIFCNLGLPLSDGPLTYTKMCDSVDDDGNHTNWTCTYYSSGPPHFDIEDKGCEAVS